MESQVMETLLLQNDVIHEYKRLVEHLLLITCEGCNPDRLCLAFDEGLIGPEARQVVENVERLVRRKDGSQ